MFKAVKGVRKDFVHRYLKEAVREVVEAHKDDTDSDCDSEEEGFEILKSIKL